MIDPSRSSRGGCCLLRLVDLIQDGVEIDRAFDGVLPPESLSFAWAGRHFRVPGMPEHSGTRCWTDFPLRDRSSRRLLGNRNGRRAQWSPFGRGQPARHGHEEPWKSVFLRDIIGTGHRLGIHKTFA